MDCVLQIVHVLMICSHIKNGGDWLCKFDWKLDGFWTKFDWRIQTSCITGVVILVLLVQGEEHGGLVVLHHVDADVDVRLVAVVHPSHGQISVQFLGMNIEFQMVVGELEAGQGENHGLHDSVCTSLDQVVAPVLLEVQEPV